MSQTYQLPVGQNDSARLKFQSDTLKQVSLPHLDLSGLSSDQTVADIGCGNGMMVLHFLDVGVKKIYAVDLFQEQLDETAKNVEEWLALNPDKPQPNIVYVKMDITNDSIPTLNDEIDLIFVRFVMCNIKNNDYNKALSNIQTLLKPGGKLVCEETVWDNITCSSCPEEIEEYKTFLQNESLKTGIDRNVGKYLPKLLLQTGYDINYYQIFDRSITPLELQTMYNSIMKIIRVKFSEDIKMDVESKNKIISTFDKWDLAFNNIQSIVDPNLKVRTSGTACITASRPIK